MLLGLDLLFDWCIPLTPNANEFYMLWYVEIEFYFTLLFGREFFTNVFEIDT